MATHVEGASARPREAAWRRVGHGLAQLVRFAWVELQCCTFAAALFLGLAVSRAVPLPVARYDALLAYAVVLTVVFFLLRLETAP